MMERITSDLERSLSSDPHVDTLVKVCPVCGARYPSADRFCAIDGQSLRDTRPESDPLIGTVVGDRYFIERRLGQGGMGVVYLAEHVRIGRRVAVKVLLPEYAHDTDAAARFHREAANLSRVNHPNVASLFDYGESAGGLLYLAMEYVDGEPLSAVLLREGHLPVGRVAGILAQTAAALHAAHGLGIVHRDLKPENVIVARAPNDVEVVKVVDFGIARAVKETAQKVTQTGGVVGTIAYMSPEQLTGEDVDSRSDLYSLALLTCVLLTGQLPFRSDSQKAILERLTVAPASLGSLAPDVEWPVALQFALNRALHAERGQRQTSTQQFAREVIDALESWRPGIISPLVRALGMLGQDVAATLSPDIIVRHATPERPATAVEATGRKPRRWMMPAALVAGALFVIAGSVAAWSARTGSASTTTVAKPPSAAPVEKNVRMSVSSPRSDSAASSITTNAPGARSMASGAGRERRVEPPRGTAAAPRRETSGPIASAASSDPVPASAPTSATGDTSTSRIEPVSSPAPPPLVPSTGLVTIGTHESGVMLFVNGRPDGPLTRLRLIRVPVGTVRLQMRADQCQAWDSTVTVRGGDSLTIGFRRPQC